MNQAKLLIKHAYILDVLCLLLSLALLFLGTKEIIPYWLLVVGTVIVFLALVASVVLFIKARKLDRAESRRIEEEILKNAAGENGGYIPEDEDEKDEVQKYEAPKEDKQ